jgi:hypothetical protein
MGEIRQDVVTTLAVRLRRDMLSADELQSELKALSRGERVALVDYLDRLDKGSLEEFQTSSRGRGFCL